MSPDTPSCDSTFPGITIITIDKYRLMDILYSISISISYIDISLKELITGFFTVCRFGRQLRG